MSAGPRHLLIPAVLALVGCAAPVGGGRTAPSRAQASAPLVVERSAQDDVAALSASDFVVRAKAGERLVARGAGALPALGAAGDVRTPAPGGASLSVTEPVIAAILERETYEELLPRLDDPAPVIRRSAAQELGRRGRWGVVPQLITRLSDSDEGVRGAAASALRRLTNEFFGYSPDATPWQRAAIVNRWREWWSVEGRAQALEREGEARSS